MVEARKRSGMSNMESRHFRILNNMSSVSLCENDIPGSSLDRRNSRTNILSVILSALLWRARHFYVLGV